MYQDLDVIELNGLKVHGKHGVFAEEKHTGHDFLIDAQLFVDLSQAAIDDSLAASVNYGAVADLIVNTVQPGSVDLIEHLAKRVLDAIFAHFPLVRAAKITINKPTAPINHPFQNVSVTLKREAPQQLALVSVGSNVGDSKEYLAKALELINKIPETSVLASSSMYQTKPVSDIVQADYLNAIFALSTKLSPWQLLNELQEIELMLHRRRIIRFGPRTLDLDLISWGEIALESDYLTLPHPRAHERAFVLVPLAEVSALLAAGGYEQQLKLGFADIDSLLSNLPASDLDSVLKLPSSSDFSMVRSLIKKPAREIK